MIAMPPINIQRRRKDLPAVVRPARGDSWLTITAPPPSRGMRYHREPGAVMKMTCGRFMVVVAAWSLTACGGGAEPAGLVRVVDEAAGENCANGGVAIQTGVDDNGNGVLDPTEAEETSYVCSNAGAPPQLVRGDEEPPGANCAVGGVAIHVGPDTDGNGVLDDNEIAATSYVCGAVVANPVIVYGNLLISNHLDTSKLVGVEEVTGSVIVDAPGLTTVNLGDLKRVGVDLRVANTAITSLAVPALQQVGRDFVVSTNTMLTSVSAPSLTMVGRDLQLYDQLTTSHFPMLTTVHGLTSGGAGTVTFPALTSAMSIRVYVGSDATTSVSFPVLTQVGKANDFGGIELTGQMLQQVQFPMLGIVYGNVQINSSNAWQGSTGFPVLTRISNQLAVTNNSALTSLSFPMLTMLVNLLVANNPMLPACQVTALATQSGATTVTNSGNNNAGTCP